MNTDFEQRFINAMHLIQKNTESKEFATGVVGARIRMMSEGTILEGCTAIENAITGVTQCFGCIISGVTYVVNSVHTFKYLQELDAARGSTPGRVLVSAAKTVGYAAGMFSTLIVGAFSPTLNLNIHLALGLLPKAVLSTPSSPTSTSSTGGGGSSSSSSALSPRVEPNNQGGNNADSQDVGSSNAGGSSHGAGGESSIASTSPLPTPLLESGNSGDNDHTNGNVNGDGSSSLERGLSSSSLPPPISPLGNQEGQVTGSQGGNSDDDSSNGEKKDGFPRLAASPSIKASDNQDDQGASGNGTGPSTVNRKDSLSSASSPSRLVASDNQGVNDDGTSGNDDDFNGSGVIDDSDDDDKFADAMSTSSSKPPIVNGHSDGSEPDVDPLD